MEEKELRKTILRYLAEHNSMTLATSSGGRQWATGLFYVNNGLLLYFLSEGKTRHGGNIKENPHAAAAIHEDYRHWKEIKGIQLEGVVEPVSNPVEKTKIMALYLKKYPFVGDFMTSPDLRRSLYAAALYRLTPDSIWYLDNEKGFSNREKITLHELQHEKIKE